MTDALTIALAQLSPALGDWLIRLRVTTASGQTHVAESVLTVE